MGSTEIKVEMQENLCPFYRTKQCDVTRDLKRQGSPAICTENYKACGTYHNQAGEKLEKQLQRGENQ